MSTVTEISKKDRFLEALQGHEHSSSDAHTSAVFSKAVDALNAQDFPTTRFEDWKYTRVGKIAGHQWKVKPSDAAVDRLTYHIPSLDCHTLVFVNGFYREDLSEVVSGSLVAMPMSLAKDKYTADFERVYGMVAKDDSSIFNAINTAYATNGAFVMAEAGENSNKPVHLVYINTDTDVIAQPRNCFIAKKNSELKIIQSHISLDGLKTFTNAVSEIHVEDNATLFIDKVQKGGEDSFLLNYERGIQHRDAHFRLSTFSLQGGWIRNTSEMEVAGENGLTDLFGAYMPTGKSHVDNHTTIDHQVPNCVSNELYKGVIHDQATGVFNGKVFVRPDAQKTNAFQQNANIVMTENGSMNSKPELEIYADDVKCSHGSTTGQFDEDAMFYLMTRGISRPTAKKLLISAFVGDVIEKASSEELRDHLLSAIQDDPNTD